MRKFITNISYWVQSQSVNIINSYFKLVWQLLIQKKHLTKKITCFDELVFLGYSGIFLSQTSHYFIKWNSVFYFFNWLRHLSERYKMIKDPVKSWETDLLWESGASPQTFEFIYIFKYQSTWGVDKLNNHGWTENRA